MTRWLAGGLATCLLITACGGDGGEDTSGETPDRVSQDEIDEAMNTPTELTFWTWVPEIEKEVALFEKAYPEISVNVVNAGAGADQYTKLRAALEAGSGVPDVAQIEYQQLPTFSITDSLLDIRPYLDQGVREQFLDWIWEQVTGNNGEVWGVPIDAGPVVMFYRKDIFDKYGIEVPETWDEFAEAARTLHQADPNVYLTNLGPNRDSFFTAMLWQAGVNPFGGSDGERISVDVTSEAAQRVASYWGDLSREGVVSTDASRTDQWFQALNRGKYATWLTAAWGTLYLKSAAESNSGLWRAAPLPQWEAGEQVSANEGGSTNTVMRTTENPIAAAKLTEFLATDPESVKMFTTEQSLFPTAESALSDPEWTERKEAYYDGQQVNKLFAEINNTVPRDFQWSPFQDQVYTDYVETVGKAFADDSDPVAALQEWESRITSYAESQGFTVE